MVSPLEEIGLKANFQTVIENGFENPDEAVRD